ncbi:MAG: inorganic phosphate transporter [Bacteroidales bacterium]|nr:inorganic phosphate transporter [Bacteroidales bacterium]
MEIIYWIIIAFLLILAVFDLIVGVSNDAVNFINSAVGAKTASVKKIIAIAAVGVFTGASMSNGMMDIARHGMFTPQYFSFYDVITIFLAVMVTDVFLLDLFNSHGMPTSTTVSMVFELLGGAVALSVIKVAKGMALEDGTLLRLSDLINTDKALSVILAIFMSVAVAFVFGTIVMWLTRILFSFRPASQRSPKTIIFGGISATVIIWFLLINGLKGSSFMTAELKQLINENTLLILCTCFAAMTLVMTVLAWLRVNILKTVVLMGTFALAMAFAGNDLVNFVGVPLTGLDAFLNYSANGAGDPKAFMMTSLQGSARTPEIFLLLAGLVMVLSLVFSKKAQNVVKTSVDLSRQSDGDEMFGSSPVARRIVRSSSRTAMKLDSIMPAGVKRWLDSRFNNDDICLEDGAAFDQLRAAVNLVLAGLLVALGTSFKLPLSTTYVTFMVAMGSSLADRAWGRDSAVFRITGVLSVIGGWFLTAGAAFFLCYVITSAMFFGGYVVMMVAILIVIAVLVKSNTKTAKESDKADSIYDKMMKEDDKAVIWDLLCTHIRQCNSERMVRVYQAYGDSTEAFVTEDYKALRRTSEMLADQKKEMKRQRKREIVALRRLDQEIVIPKTSWYYHNINACKQILYCLNRINDPVREHIGNGFAPIPEAYREKYMATRKRVLDLIDRTTTLIEGNGHETASDIIKAAREEEATLEMERNEALGNIQQNRESLNTQLITIHIIQESQELLDQIRQMLHGMEMFFR